MMSHECQRLLELLHDFVSGELAPTDLAAIQSHLQACPPCEIYVQTYRLTITMTRTLPPAEIPTTQPNGCFRLSNANVPNRKISRGVGLMTGGGWGRRSIPIVVPSP